jgi:hypothetical protein
VTRSTAPELSSPLKRSPSCRGSGRAVRRLRRPRNEDRDYPLTFWCDTFAMPSVVVSWSGACPQRAVRDALVGQLEPIAAVSRSYFDQPPEVAIFDGRVEGRIVVSDLVVDGCDAAVPIPDESDPGPAPEVELRLAGPLNTTITILGPLYSIPYADLHGITFHLYDGRGFYPEEDLLSFVFATFPGDAAPYSRMVEVLPADQLARATRSTIRQATCCLIKAQIHLRYYCEEWLNLLLGTIKYFYVPDLFWRPGREDCPGYAKLQAFYERKDDELADLGFDGALADLAFGSLASGLLAEIESSSGEAAAIKSFWDRIGNRGD